MLSYGQTPTVTLWGGKPKRKKYEEKIGLSVGAMGKVGSRSRPAASLSLGKKGLEKPADW